MRRLLIYLLIFFPLIFIVGSVFAEDQAEGLGLVAQNLMEPVSVFSDFIHSACFIIGGSFLFASIVKYIEHRRSPLMVPISNVVFLIVAGLALVLLPFLSIITENGVKYSLFN